MVEPMKMDVLKMLKATAHKAYAATQPGTLADMAGI